MIATQRWLNVFSLPITDTAVGGRIRCWTACPASLETSSWDDAAGANRAHLPTPGESAVTVFWWSLQTCALPSAGLPGEQLLFCLWIGRDDAPGAIHEAADLPSKKKKCQRLIVSVVQVHIWCIFFSTQEGGLNPVSQYPISCFCSFMLKIRSVPSERKKKKNWTGSLEPCNVNPLLVMTVFMIRCFQTWKYTLQLSSSAAKN